MTRQQLKKLKDLAKDLLDNKGPSATVTVSVESILTVLERMEAAENMLEDLEEEGMLGNDEDYGDTH